MAERTVIVKGVSLTKSELEEALARIKQPVKATVVHVKGSHYHHYMYVGTVREAKDRLNSFAASELDKACLVSMHDANIYHSPYDRLEISPLEDQWRNE